MQAIAGLARLASLALVFLGPGIDNVREPNLDMEVDLAQPKTLGEQDVRTLEQLLADQGRPRAIVPGRSWETMNSISVAVEEPKLGQSLLKLYRHEKKYRHEVTALGRLTGSDYAPFLHLHGQLANPIAIRHQRADRNGEWGFFILRSWLDGVPGEPPPVGERDAFVKAVFAFCDHCALNGLLVGDMKADCYIWRNDRFTWIDYDGFKTTEDYAERIRTENRRYLRSRLERLGILDEGGIQVSD